MKLLENQLTRRDFLKVSGSVAVLTQIQPVSAQEWLTQMGKAGSRPDLVGADAKLVRSVCLMCHSGCGIQGTIVNGELVKLDGNPYHPNTYDYVAKGDIVEESDLDGGLGGKDVGTLCAKGQAGNRLHTRLPIESIPRELADLADTLNGMLSRLEESFQRLSDFSSNLAHELRTPVSNLLTQTQVTLSKARSADEYRDILASNAEEFERLSRTIADMLFLAKADNKLIIPNQERIDLAEKIGDLLEYYEVLADEKAITLSLAGNGQVFGDRLMLHRAVSNLLSNALRHTPSGGKVVVRIDKDEHARVLVSVENTGSDIPPEHLPRLFDRFYRVDSSRHRTTENSGLGLAITRSIVLAHGGDVGVDSANGITRFTLSLPGLRR